MAFEREDKADTHRLQAHRHPCGPGLRIGLFKSAQGFFETHRFDYRIIKSDIGPKAHSPENRENPCFLCSRLRRKIIFETAGELGCRKIAFGHHKDDLIETFFLNLFYGASISTMLPVQELFGGRIAVIRPLYMVDEDVISRYAGSMEWPKISLNCPTAGSSKRNEIKQMLLQFYRANRKTKATSFTRSRTSERIISRVDKGASQCTGWIFGCKSLKRCKYYSLNPHQIRKGEYMILKMLEVGPLMVNCYIVGTRIRVRPRSLIRGEMPPRYWRPQR